MQFAIRAPFRIGGTRGGWKLLFGELAELGEEMLPIYVFMCSKCGRLELFVDKKTQERLSNRKLSF